MVLVAAAPLLWAVGAKASAVIWRLSLPVSSLWRIVSYSMAPGVVALPLQSLWQAWLDYVFEHPVEMPDSIARIPAIIAGLITLIYFSVAIWRVVQKRRFVYVATALLILMAPAVALPLIIRIVRPRIEPKLSPRFEHPISFAARADDQWRQDVQFLAGDTIGLSVGIVNRSDVVARNVVIRVDGPTFLNNARDAIFITSVRCANCEYTEYGVVELFGDTSVRFRQTRFTLYRGRDQSRPATIPRGASASDILHPVGLAVGDVAPGPDGQVVAQIGFATEFPSRREIIVDPSAQDLR